MISKPATTATPDLRLVIAICGTPSDT
jgi:hypothetical protein